MEEIVEEYARNIKSIRIHSQFSKQFFESLPDQESSNDDIDLYDNFKN
jgi:hypothetical protein